MLLLFLELYKKERTYFGYVVYKQVTKFLQERRKGGRKKKEEKEKGEKERG